MAVTKMWVVKGSLSSPLEYIMQDAKTVQHGEAKEPYSETDLMSLRNIMDFEGQSKAHAELEAVLGYVAQGRKTDDEKFVTGVSCVPETARQEMDLVKKQWNKTGGNICLHCYQSFRPGEVTPELAHNLGVEMAQALWGDRFQVVVATHLDRQHVHNHFVINTVSFVDGKRFHYGQEAYDLMRITSDKLCQEYGLSVIERPKHGRQVNPTAYEKAGIQKKPSNRSLIKLDIDDAVLRSKTMDDFYRILRQKGYSFRQGNLKHVSLKGPGMDQSVRLNSLEKLYGPGYSLEGITQRIADQQGRTPFPANDMSNTESPQGGSLPVVDDDDWWQAEDPPIFPTGQDWVLQQPQSVPSASTIHAAMKPAALNPLPKQPSSRKVTFRGRFPKQQRSKGSFRGLYLHYCYVFGLFPKQKKYRSHAARSQVRKMRNIAKETRLLISNRIDTMEQLVAYRAARQATVTSLCAQRKILYNRLRNALPEERENIQSQIDSYSALIRQEREQVRLCDDIHSRAVSEARTAENEHLQLQAEEMRNTEKEESENECRTGCSEPGRQSNDAAHHRSDKDASDLIW